jgi:hypothetical protein
MRCDMPTLRAPAMDDRRYVSLGGAREVIPGDKGAEPTPTRPPSASAGELVPPRHHRTPPKTGCVIGHNMVPVDGEVHDRPAKPIVHPTELPLLRREHGRPEEERGWRLNVWCSREERKTGRE